MSFGKLAVLSFPAVLAAFLEIPLVAWFRDGVGSWWPRWDPSVLYDLYVYWQVGGMVASGSDVQGTILPWIYPPFAALLAAPLSIVPFWLLAVLWTWGSVLALAYILKAVGLDGWTLAIATLAAVVAVEPVRETLGYGQLGIFIVALVLAGVGRSQRSSGGVLIGLTSAVKLTPALFAVTDFFSARTRGQWGGVGGTSVSAHRVRAYAALCAFLGATALGHILLPQMSTDYWVGLAGGDSGYNQQIYYYTNQSLQGALARIVGQPPAWGLVLSVVLIVFGVWVSVRVYRSGQPLLAVCLTGLTTLLGSPISWSHHWIWVVPLAVVLWRGEAAALRRSSSPDTPTPSPDTSTPSPDLIRGGVPPTTPAPTGPLRSYALAYCAWVALAPWRLLPHKGGVEYAYNAAETLIIDASLIGGVVLLAWIGLKARRAHTLG
ncbi:MAG: glycosyltransferase 87 family protein [Propionibacteriaceae bacterium]|jgi:alpha-1,2-mannosyltransferase|nr:glycosyltransferase 87 family protein [Propionibacteriaceae bacterium]